MSVRPIHIAAIGVGNVRFYSSEPGGLPLIAVEDLFRAIGWSLGRREQAIKELTRGKAVSSIDTETGPVGVVPFIAAMYCILHEDTDDAMSKAAVGAAFRAFFATNPDSTLDSFVRLFASDLERLTREDSAK